MLEKTVIALLMLATFGGGMLAHRNWDTHPQQIKILTENQGLPIHYKELPPGHYTVTKQFDSHSGVAFVSRDLETGQHDAYPFYVRDLNSSTEGTTFVIGGIHRR